MGHTQRRFVETRCRCLRCGAHVIGPVGFATLAARCSTCGSYEIVPLELHDRAERIRASVIGSDLVGAGDRAERI